MMKKITFIAKIIGVFMFLFCNHSIKAQVFSLGAKYDKAAMFQASFNVPVLFDKYKPYDFAFGLDYTSPNAKAPSGLQPQFTAMYFLVDDKYKSYNISAGITSGYLFDFNKEFNNQFRVSPYVYTEVFPFTIKVGHEYVMPLNQGQFFISIGIGGGYLFRHFSIM
ncbi:hypothetical protein [Paenimyroides baculatum]|uniref:Outer membrane protein beta-barrel domain-containing protein n=1 Tax=Paenimyroides baculatum TaxID=2608000 RepID=A0A5M6CGG6_9FLAO|nr:hypothetical protein [Paenimyroides baculatum]KAA5534284.1 hypothetical protein F0460_09255 [Paenimyroides baculatum]